MLRSTVKELELIERIRRGAAIRQPGVRVGMGDDCAVLRVRAGEEMVVTTDFLLEGRHFRRDWHSAESAGWRCLARGLSDIAAMGARPVAAFLSLALPAGFDPGWVDGFLRGLETLAGECGVELAGGDTAQAPGEQVLADIVLVGAVAEGQALLRSGARVGDGIYCTGELGGSAVELAGMLRDGAGGYAGFAGGRQRFPRPRIEAGLRLVGVASACMDLSDGISSDAQHLARASGVRMEFESAALPFDEGATLAQALGGGEDYELLFTASGPVPDALDGVKVTRIGSVVAGAGVWLDGVQLEPAGWEHFAG